jgi:hypothetical protein
MNTDKLNFVFPSKTKMISMILMAVGLVSIVCMFVFDTNVEDHHYQHNRAWANLFAGSFYFMGIALASVFFLALQYAAESGWSTTIKRLMEAVISFLPYGLSFLLLIFICGQIHLNTIYPWMAEGVSDINSPNYDAVIAGKSGYFGIFWWVRTILYMVAWVLFAWKLRKNSSDADALGIEESKGFHWKNIKLSAYFLVLFAYTSSTAAWDWLMSIDTHWFSTMMGWYVFSGMWVSSMITITLLVVWLKKNGYLEFVTESTVHDIGKWMFAISFLWTYLYFSQFMLIWYADIPEEVVYYKTRWESYKALMWAVFFVNFLFPMVLLMSRDSKRNFYFLVFVGTIIFIGHYLDMIMIVMPGTVGHNWTGLSWMEIGNFLFFLGLFIYVVLTNLAKRPLLVKNHPFLSESLHHSY